MEVGNSKMVLSGWKDLLKIHVALTRSFSKHGEWREIAPYPVSKISVGDFIHFRLLVVLTHKLWQHICLFTTLTAHQKQQQLYALLYVAYGCH